MTKSYNEFFNAEQKQKNELVYACGGGYAVSFSQYSKGCIQADCDIFYDVPGKGRSAVFVDDHGMGTRWIIC